MGRGSPASFPREDFTGEAGLTGTGLSGVGGASGASGQRRARQGWGLEGRWGLPGASEAAAPLA